MLFNRYYRVSFPFVSFSSFFPGAAECKFPVDELSDRLEAGRGGFRRGLQRFEEICDGLEGFSGFENFCLFRIEGFLGRNNIANIAFVIN